MPQDPDSPDDAAERDEFPYVPKDSIDFTVLTMGMKRLSFFDDDTFLGMQAMNVGIVDSIITQQEYLLLRRLFDEERTPADLACKPGPRQSYYRRGPGLQGLPPRAA